jgi:dephospho-CoA kinase
MLRVGITGGIGSGKTTVSKIFEVLGIPVYYADTAAKHLMENDPELIRQIISIFGEPAYKDGKLNRSYISGIAFNQPAKLEALNAVVHPATINDAARWMEKQKAPYSIKEAALIFESGTQSQYDFIIGVFSPRAIRINRVIKRDNITAEEVKKRMDRQINEEIKMRLCDAVITNNDQQLIIPQALALHQHLLELGGRKSSTPKPG